LFNEAYLNIEVTQYICHQTRIYGIVVLHGGVSVRKMIQDEAN